MAFSIKRMAQPYISSEIIGIKHQTSNSVVQLLSDIVFLIREGNARDSSMRWLSIDSKSIVGCQKCIFVEW